MNTKKMTSLKFEIEKTNYSTIRINDIEGDEFNGNHLLSINGIFFYGWIVFWGIFLFIKSDSITLVSISSIFTFVMVLFFIPALLSFQMHYFIITREFLVVKNTVWFWMREIYLLEDIKEIVIETPHKRETSLRIITTDYRDKLYSAGSLRNKTWKRLIEKFEIIKIKVRNETIN